MHSQGVLIQINHPKFGIAKGSGLQIDNIIITHGSLLASMCLSDNDCEDILKRYNSIVKELQSEHSKLRFSVLHRKNNSYVYTNQKGYHNNSKIVCSSENCTLEDATFIMLYNYAAMLDISKEISNWTDSYSSEQQLGDLLLPKFLILTVDKPSYGSFKTYLHTIFNTLKSCIFYPGLPLVIESTPFGNFSFFNSWSRGIVSKIIGSNSDGLVTDARLVLGCEGGPIYTFENEVKGDLIGIVVLTISWCNGEWIGFSLGLSIKHLIKSILGLQSTIDYIPFDKFVKDSFLQSVINLDQLVDSVVFVRCRHKWGSGVVIDEEAGLILTCSHVIEHDHNAVHVLCKGRKFPAEVVYASPSTSPYDLALLSAGKRLGLKKLKWTETPPVLGERVVAVGYPLSSESLVMLNNSPTLSAGCVAKISRRGGPLQTTCCTQSGLSGGALVRPPNQLLGVIVSNVRFDNTTMPCFSFAISAENLRVPITQYLSTKDPSCLHTLCQDRCEVKMEWALMDCKL